MLKSVKVVLAAALAALLLAGCSFDRGRSGRGLRSDELLMTVPSDAAVVALYSRCSDLLKVALDSSDVLAGCIPSRLRHSKAVLSWTYNGTLVPLLSIAAPSDTSSAVRALCDSASARGLFVRYLDSSVAPLGKGVVLVSRSENLVESSLRHVFSGHCIFDSKGFPEALRSLDSGDDFIVWSNEAAGKWVRKDAFSGIYSRRSVVSFVKDLAQWTVVLPSEVSVPYEASVILYRDGGGRYYADFLRSLRPSGSKVSEMLPSSCDFLVDFPVRRMEEFIESFRRHLDCRAALSAYQSDCASMKLKYGLDPEKWASDYDFKEVALARWEGRSVILLRPSRKPSSSELTENRFPGYAAQVFGKAFSLADDTALGVSGRWMMIGSEDDVRAFLDVPDELRGLELPKWKCRFVVYDVADGAVNLLSEKNGKVFLNVN